MRPIRLLIVTGLLVCACKSYRVEEIRLDTHGAAFTKALPVKPYIDVVGATDPHMAQDLVTIASQVGRSLPGHELRGRLKVAIEIEDLSVNPWWLATHIGTVFVASLLGVPAASQSADVAVTLEINDANRRTLGRYTAHGHAKNYAAMYWGYSAGAAAGTDTGAVLTRVTVADASMNAIDQALESLALEAPRLHRLLALSPTVASEILEAQEALVHQYLTQFEALERMAPGSQERSFLEHLINTEDPFLLIMDAEITPTQVVYEIAAVPPDGVLASWSRSSARMALDALQDRENVVFTAETTEFGRSAGVLGATLGTFIFTRIGKLQDVEISPTASQTVERLARETAEQRYWQY